MKSKLTIAIVSILLLSLTGCLSTGTTSSSNSLDALKDVEAVNQVEKLDLINKTIIGTDSNGSPFSLTFMAEGKLALMMNEESFEGTWDFKEDFAMMPHTIEWEMNGEQQGYMVSVSKIDESIQIYGYWYITDLLKTITLTGLVVSN